MRADNLRDRHYKSKHPNVDTKLMIPILDDAISVACKSQAPVKQRQLLEVDDVGEAHPQSEFKFQYQGEHDDDADSFLDQPNKKVEPGDDGSEHMK